MTTIIVSRRLSQSHADYHSLVTTITVSQQPSQSHNNHHSLMPTITVSQQMSQPHADCHAAQPQVGRCGLITHSPTTDPTRPAPIARAPGRTAPPTDTAPRRSPSRHLDVVFVRPRTHRQTLVPGSSRLHACARSARRCRLRLRRGARSSRLRDTHPHVHARRSRARGYGRSAQPCGTADRPSSRAALVCTPAARSARRCRLRLRRGARSSRLRDTPACTPARAA